MFTSVEEALESVNELLQQTLKNSIKVFETNLTNGLGWEQLTDRWEKDQSFAEIYLSSIDKEYEIQKLINKINKDLLANEYSRLDAQKKINQFKNKELELLIKKDKLTQSELDRANKLYELTLLQIALEDARNNKTSMQLTRDSQGNYVYQYGTDEQEVASAQQEVNDKVNEIYNDDIASAIEAISNFNDAGQSLGEELNSIFENEKFQEYLGLSSSDKGRKSLRFKELEEWINDSFENIIKTSDYKMQAYQQQALQSLEYALNDLEMSNVNLDNLTKEQEKILESEGIDINKLNYLKSYNSNFAKNQLEEMKKQVSQLTDNYGKNVENVLNAAGLTGENQYYETTDLIKINTDIMREELSKESDNVKKTYIEINKFMRYNLPKLEDWFEGFFKENGEFSNGIGKITGALETNATAVTNAIEDAVDNLTVAMGETQQVTNNLMSGFAEDLVEVASDLNNLQTKINDNEKYLADYISAGKTKIEGRTFVENGPTADGIGTVVTYKGGNYIVSKYDADTGKFNLHEFGNSSNKVNDVTASEMTVIGSVNGSGHYFTRYDSSTKKGIGSTGPTMFTLDNEEVFLNSNKQWQSVSDTTQPFKTHSHVEYKGADGWMITGVNTSNGKITIKNLRSSGKGEVEEKTVSAGDLTYKSQIILADAYYNDMKSKIPAFQSKNKNSKKQFEELNIIAITEYGNVLGYNQNTGTIKWLGSEAQKNWLLKSQPYINNNENSPNSLDLYVKNRKNMISQFDGFNTGGYTGAWFNGSKDGRLALLHQKELILNETDTPKILDAVKTVRELSAGSISRNIENKLASTIASLEDRLLQTYSSIDSMAAATTQSQGQFLEQAVQIDASFPGVRDSREIEDALKNLVNVASQYAYERK